MPKRVDLDGFSAARCDNPIAHLGIHPGELVTLLTLHQETVVWIDMDIKLRATQMMVDDIDQARQKLLQGVAIFRGLEITAKRVKEPKGSIGGVIFSFSGTIGKHVWNQAIANVMRERAQDVACLEPASGDQGE